MDVRELGSSRLVGSLRRLGAACGLAVGLAAFAGPSPGRAQPPGDVEKALAAEAGHFQTGAYVTTVKYVVEFYPLWLTYYQSRAGTTNRLVGPVRISPLYHIVVAINDDTLYASTFLDLSQQPVILTVPATKATYSILSLDPYGDIFQSGIEAGTPGTYGLVGPGYKGRLPRGVTRVEMPLDFSILIFRVDKHSDGANEIEAAETFRRSLRMQELCDYTGTTCPDGRSPDRSGGHTVILPEAAFSEPFKQAADALITKEPLDFLQQLQVAVGSSNTPPLSRHEKHLSERFDRLFNGGDLSRWRKRELSLAARAAHKLILERYFTHTGRTNWIHFTDIGDWGDKVLDRAAIAEFIQYGNGSSTAAYYHAFKDENGGELDGTAEAGYVLTFSKNQIPEAERFWSITAYMPDSIELVPNSEQKYLVASYTKGLQYNADGSLSVYLSRTPPADKPQANWLPVPPGAFNVMLRVYGPEGNVADGTYVPPAIAKRR